MSSRWSSSRTRSISSVDIPFAGKLTRLTSSSKRHGDVISPHVEATLRRLRDGAALAILAKHAAYLWERPRPTVHEPPEAQHDVRERSALPLPPRPRAAPDDAGGP